MDTTLQHQEIFRHSAFLESVNPTSDALELTDDENHRGVGKGLARDTARQARSKGGLAAWQIQRIARYIRERLHTKLSIKVLASQVYLSEFHFCRAFRLSFGDSPHVYVTRCRVEVAKTLLTSTSKPIGDIALECGAADQAHFTNLFRRSAGHTPGSWRRMRKEKSYDIPTVPGGEPFSGLAI